MIEYLLDHDATRAGLMDANPQLIEAKIVKMDNLIERKSYSIHEESLLNAITSRIRHDAKRPLEKWMGKMKVIKFSIFSVGFT